jgi:hypothetical protein
MLYCYLHISPRANEDVQARIDLKTVAMIGTENWVSLVLIINLHRRGIEQSKQPEGTDNLQLYLNLNCNFHRLNPIP